jgi:hypothetical protein
MNETEQIDFLCRIRHDLQAFIIANAPTAVSVPEADGYAEYYLAEDLHFIGLGYGTQKWDEIPLEHLAYWVGILRPPTNDCERNRRQEHDAFFLYYRKALGMIRATAGDCNPDWYQGEYLSGNSGKALTSIETSGKIESSNGKGMNMATAKCSDEVKLAELNAKEAALTAQIQKLRSDIGKTEVQRSDLATEIRALFGN